MARNLMATSCYHCGHDVEITEQPHEITEAEAGRFIKEYEGMIVAHAICPICQAQYLAWIDMRNRKHYSSNNVAEYGKVLDLSYYSTFNDEPGPDDLPKYDVQVITTWHRVARINSE